MTERMLSNQRESTASRRFAPLRSAVPRFDALQTNSNEYKFDVAVSCQAIETERDFIYELKNIDIGVDIEENAIRERNIS